MYILKRKGFFGDSDTVGFFAYDPIPADDQYVVEEVIHGGENDSMFWAGEIIQMANTIFDQLIKGEITVEMIRLGKIPAWKNTANKHFPNLIE